MIRFTKSGIVLAAAASAALVASSASAASINLAFVGVNPGLTESVSTNSGGSFTDYSTGQLKFSISNNVGAGLLPSSGNLLTFCVELTGGVDNNSQPFQVLGPGTGSFVSPLSAAKGNLLTAFFNQYYTPILTNTPLSGVQLSAFQLDIWELLLDATPGTLTAGAGGGTFQVKGNDAAVIQGNAWLSTFNPNTGGVITLLQLQSDSLQDQIVPVVGAGALPTPLPSALPAGLVLMTGAALFGKLRRRKA